RSCPAGDCDACFGDYLDSPSLPTWMSQILSYCRDLGNCTEIGAAADPTGACVAAVPGEQCCGSLSGISPDRSGLHSECLVSDTDAHCSPPCLIDTTRECGPIGCGLTITPPTGGGIFGGFTCRCGPFGNC